MKRVIVARTPRWVGLLLLLVPSSACAQSVTASATPDRARVLLSESIRVTLAFEGPAPLRVELPERLLSVETDRDWRIRSTGPAAVTPLPAGKERWSQVYRLDPFVPGESLLVAFAPVKVNGREVTPAAFSVAVSSAVAEVKAEAARPVTGIEELPSPPIDDTVSAAPWLWAAGALLVLAVALLVWRLRRPPPPVPPHEWALAAFGRLDRDRLSGAALVERVAAVVREFIDRRFGIPAPKLTTAELLAAAQQADWPAGQTAALQQLLEICDRAKFAGDVPDDEACRELRAAARDWVQAASPAPSAGERTEP